MGLCAILLGILAFLVGISAVYTFMYIDIFSVSNTTEKTVPMMITICALLSFFLSFYAVGNSLFGAKDYDMLQAYPIRTSTIVLSKVTVMYISDLLFSIIVGTTALCVYATKFYVSFSFAIITVINLFIVPLMPLALSIVIGTLVNFLASKLKRKNALMNAFYMLLFVGIIALSFSSTDDLGLLALINKLYFLFPLMVGGYQSVTTYLLFAFINIASVVVVVYLTCRLYSIINTGLKSKGKAKNFAIKKQKEQSVLVALFKRENKRLFSLPVYFVNSFFGCIMLVGLGIGALVLSIVLGQIVSSISLVILPFVIPIFFFSCCMSPTTYASISLEGNNFWLIKTMPIDYKTLINAKLLVNVIFYGSSALFSSLLLVIALKLNVLLASLVVLSCVSISLFGGTMGIIANLKLPNLNWTNPQQVVKQGASGFMMMVVAFLLTAVFGVGGYLLFFINSLNLTLTNITFYYGVFTFVMIVVNVCAYKLLTKKTINKLQLI